MPKLFSSRKFRYQRKNSKLKIFQNFQKFPNFLKIFNFQFVWNFTETEADLPVKGIMFTLEIYQNPNNLSLF